MANVHRLGAYRRDGSDGSDHGCTYRFTQEYFYSGLPDPRGW